jgi:predicted ATP-grasp superfamily ATP-dependent carboligase
MVRRFPAGMGSGVCQQTAKDLPEVQELSLKLFKSAGVKGLLNTEYIRDHRDGTLKLIECNGRFTGVNRLLIDSGLNINLHVYNRLTGGPPVPLDDYRDGPMFWDPIGDLYAFRERRRTGELTLFTWLGTLRLPIVLPVFQWDDPVPSLIDSGRFLGRVVNKTWSVLGLPFRRSFRPRKT